jgi:hypothetical protein
MNIFTHFSTYDSPTPNELLLKVGGKKDVELRGVDLGVDRARSCPGQPPILSEVTSKYVT